MYRYNVSKSILKVFKMYVYNVSKSLLKGRIIEKMYVDHLSLGLFQ